MEPLYKIGDVVKITSPGEVVDGYSGTIADMHQYKRDGNLLWMYYVDVKSLTTTRVAIDERILSLVQR